MHGWHHAGGPFAITLREPDAPYERPKPRLLDQVRGAIRTRHMSYRTEACLPKRCVGGRRTPASLPLTLSLSKGFFHHKRHPAEMGPALALDAEQPKTFAVILEVAFFTFWFGPVPEEIGWRGFALDRLQCRMNALTSSLLLGTIWALWHLPFFYIPGTYQYDLGLGTTRSWLFLVHFLPLSVLMTWIYNSTRRSTLSAVLVHFSGNLCVALLPTTDRIAAFEVMVLTCAALAITMVYGRAQLSR